MKINDGLKLGDAWISLHDAKITALLILGFERKEIADKLGISKNTLNTEMRILFKVLHVRNAVRLAVIAMENGFDSRGRYKRMKIISA